MESASRLPKAPMTADELWERHAELGRCELVDGEVIEMPPTGFPHGEAEIRIGAHLLAWASSRGARVGVGGYAIDARNVRGADVSVHVTQTPSATGWTKTPPDVVVEVVSPNDRWTEIEQKAAMWIAFGVREVWIADPATRRILVRRPDGSAATFGPADTLVSGVLEGFAVSVEELLPP